MIEAARDGDAGLLGRQPALGQNALGHGLSGFNLRVRTIARADSARQVHAIARQVRDRLKEAGATLVGVEGEESGEWVLVDAGDIVVHVMQPAVRAYYNLEELWTPHVSLRREAHKNAA